MSIDYKDLGALKKGSYVIIDGEPCKVIEITKSKKGKHGSAQARVVAIGIFDGVKRSVVGPVDTRVEVPIIKKGRAQIVAVTDSIQLMDLETYEVFEAPLPEDEELRSKLDSGVTIEYWDFLGKKKIVRVRPE
ncbi:MAG TPA: translation initiation factor IF-5A [Thermoprotei archaeon]|nr:translation initiation factor IF-5A [Thermoprotei archaeon]